MKRTTAANSVSGHPVDRNTGTGTTGTTWGAEDWDNHQEEIIAPILALGLELDGEVQNQLYKAIVGLSHVVGETLFMETDDTPGALFPAVPRNVDIDIAAANYPLLVPKLRAVKASILGTVDFSVTVSGSTVTFADTPAGVKLLNLIAADALVAGWLNGGQAATYTSDYSTAATRRCITIAGTEYAIAGTNLVAKSLTVVGSPASGAQTASVYTYRIPGEANKARLLKIAGFVGVAAGDVDGEVVGGWRKMDRLESHVHNQSYSSTASTTNGTYPKAVDTNNQQQSSYSTGVPSGDGTNTLRAGKTTDPRTNGQYVFTWAGVYAA